MISPMKVQWYERMLADPYLPAHIRAEIESRKKLALLTPTISIYTGKVNPDLIPPWELAEGEIPHWPELPPGSIRGWDASKKRPKTSKHYNRKRRKRFNSDKS